MTTKMSSVRNLFSRQAKMASLALVLGALSVNLAHAGSATAAINDINTNSQWGGTFVQLNIPVSFIYESACVVANWAFVPTSDPQYNSHVQNLIGAKNTGNTVTIVTAGCVSTPQGPAPRIVAVEYGTRFPGS